MFHVFWGFLGLAITGIGALFGFALAREFVRNRLRFVDSVRHPVFPWVVALGATLVAWPVVALIGFLHLVGGGAALIFGAMAGLGSASGVKALKRGD